MNRFSRNSSNVTNGGLKKTKVLVIGAGIAGISAASRLSTQDGYDVTVLEASSRIGGRIHTTSLDGYRVEMGAQWIHGTKGNIVHQLAEEEGGLVEDSIADFLNSQYLLSSGSLVDTNLTSRLIVLYYSAQSEYERRATSPLSVNSNGNFGDYIKASFKEIVAKEGVKVSDDFLTSFLEQIHQFENSINASDSWHELSPNSLAEYHVCEGNPVISWKKGGYATIFDLVQNNFGLGVGSLKDKVLLNKEVTRIEWDDRHNNGPSANGKRVRCQCSDGTVYKSDFVIVTVSLGVLKAKSSALFKPALPQSKLTAINGLCIGTVDKMFLSFPYRWWPDDLRGGYSFVWTKEDLQSELFNSEDERWGRDVFGFNIVDHAPQILCGWVVGKSARQMETQSDQFVMDVCYRLLRKFLPPSYNVPRPLHIKRSCWHSDTHIQGSYSYRSLTTDKLNTSSTILGEPVSNSNGQQVLLFAGEATHPHYYSTVHGAIETGLREADRIISTHSRSSL